MPPLAPLAWCGAYHPVGALDPFRELCVRWHMRLSYVLATTLTLALLGCAHQRSSNDTAASPSPAAANAAPASNAPASAPAGLNSECRFLGPRCPDGLMCNTPPSSARNAAGICTPAWTGEAEGAHCGTIAGLKCGPGLVCIVRDDNMDDASGVCTR